MRKLKFTKQEIINKIVEHFRQQKALAWDASQGHCRYRTTDGRKCAVGALIPDALYHEDFEEKSIKSFKLHFGWDAIPFYAKDMLLLDKLQKAHDFSAAETGRQPEEQVSRFFDRVREICVTHHLKFPEETNA